MGLRGCAVARPVRVSEVAWPGSAGPEALERGEGRGVEASRSLLAEGAARRRALLVRGKPMVGWLCGLLVAMAGLRLEEDSGQRAGPRLGEKDRQPCGSQPPLPT